MNEIICPKCQTKNEADSVYCIECKNVLDLNQYIESKKLKDSGLSKLKSSIGIKTKENKINDEIEEFIILFQKFSKYDEDLKELKSEFINEKSAKKFKEKYVFEFWEKVSDAESAVRFCTSWATKPEVVEELIRDIEAC